MFGLVLPITLLSAGRAVIKSGGGLVTHAVLVMVMGRWATVGLVMVQVTLV